MKKSYPLKKAVKKPKSKKQLPAKIIFGFPGYNIQLMFNLLSLVIILATITCVFTVDSPSSIRSGFIPRKALVAGSAALGLTLGKIYLNGRTFNEDVNMNGKDVVITGGNTGLGKETAVNMAALGANVYILCKSMVKAASAVKNICEESGSSKVYALPLNLGDLESVKSCFAGLNERLTKVDVLVNNAGVMALPKRNLTVDGFEYHIGKSKYISSANNFTHIVFNPGINHLGHFALTALLFPLLQNAPDARSTFLDPAYLNKFLPFYVLGLSQSAVKLTDLQSSMSAI